MWERQATLAQSIVTGNGSRGKRFTISWGWQRSSTVTLHKLLRPAIAIDLNASQSVGAGMGIDVHGLYAIEAATFWTVFGNTR